MFRLLAFVALTIGALLFTRAEPLFFPDIHVLDVAMAASATDPAPDPGGPVEDGTSDPLPVDPDGADEEESEDREALLSESLELPGPTEVFCLLSEQAPLRPNLTHREHFRPPRSPLRLG